MATYMDSAPKLKRPRLESASDETQLAELNEDCLISLFRYLPLNDLNAVSGTCHRFRGIAINNVYRCHASLKRFDIGTMAERYRNKVDENDLGYSVKCIKGYLQRFGPFIDHIDFQNDIFQKTQNEAHSRNIIELVVDYCLSGLKSLKIRNFNSDWNGISNIHLLFGNLIKLDIDDCGPLFKLFPLCKSVQELSVNINYFGSKFGFGLTPAFPKLHKITVTVGNRIQCTEHHQQLIEDTVGALIKTNLNLASFSMTLPCFFDISKIGQLKHLDELYLDIARPQDESGPTSLNLQPFYDLSNLRKVEIKGFHRSIYGQFLRQTASAQTLDHLTIGRFRMDEEFIDGLSRLHRLRYLSLVAIAPLSDRWDISEAIWHQLHGLNNIIELRLRAIRYALGQHFLNQLSGARHLLKKLSLSFYVIDYCQNGFGHALAHFEHLEQLELKLNSKSCEVTHWGPLQRLTRLKCLNLVNSGPAVGKSLFRLFLNNIGSHDTLEQLYMAEHFDEDDFSIEKFVNLKELTIANYSADNLNMFRSLKKIRKFTVNLVTREPLSHNSIDELVRQWPSLELFELSVQHTFTSSRKLDKIMKYISHVSNELPGMLRARYNFRQIEISSHSRFVAIKLAIKMPVCNAQINSVNLFKR